MEEKLSYEEQAKRHALNLRQCSIFAADVGKHIAQSMTDAADFLEGLEDRDKEE